MGDAELHRTFVLFGLDRLVAGAWVFRADDSNVDSQVEAVARALGQRVEGVLTGDIVGTPVPVPQTEGEAPAALPPPADAMGDETDERSTRPV